MKNRMRQLSLMVTAFLTISAYADNALTQADLLSIAKSALDDYTANNPEHAKHISGFRVTTSGKDGKVKLYINHGGMTMESDYLCIRQDAAFECREQG
jgi:hypothetical protein